MKTSLTTIAAILALCLPAAAQINREASPPGARYTVAVNYPQGKETSIDMRGTSIAPSVIGKAEIKRTEGRTRIKLKMENLLNPQSLGSFYTTYVLWAIAPEGQADNLAEFPFKGNDYIDVTTSFQTFSLVVTAEPYSAVKLPSLAVVAENFLREGTKGGIQSSRIQYRGESGTLYANESIPPDYNTPLPVLGARCSVEIAKREGAERYARPELEKAEVSLAALEQIWPPEREHEKKFGGMARDVMREAENARELTLRRSDEARLTAERQAAQGAISSARTEAQVARNQAAAANERAEDYKQAMSRAQQEVDQAKQQVSAAQNEADRAKANEVLAKAQADEARLQAEQAKKDKEDAEQKLYVSLSAILATRREARGLVVSLSDVLFDFNKATLKPGAREKLSKLTGILLAYPGPYHIEIDGYTDSVGSDEYNMRLSEDRANSVRAYLEQSGLSADRITGVKGYGKTLPVASNDTAEGRQMNRRVELVISDTQQTP